MKVLVAVAAAFCESYNLLHGEYCVVLVVSVPGWRELCIKQFDLHYLDR